MMKHIRLALAAAIAGPLHDAGNTTGSNVGSQASKEVDPSSEAPENNRSQKSPWYSDVSRLLSWEAVFAAVYLAFAYSYLFGFYEQFGVSPVEVGLNQGVMLQRLFLDGPFLIGLVLVAVYLVILARWSGPFKPKTEESGRPRMWLRPVAFVVITLLLASTVVGSDFFGIGLYAVGHSDAIAAIEQRSDTNYVSFWEGLFGGEAQPVLVRWYGSGPSPLSNDEDYALFLGEVGAETSVFDLNSCTLLQLPTGSISLRYVSRTYAQRPPNSLHLPPHCSAFSR